MLATLIVLTAQLGQPIVYADERVGDIPVSVVRVDPGHPGIRCGVVVASGFPGADEPFKEMVARNKPRVAINGAYFSKDNLKPIGDLVIEGRLVSAGRMGTAFTIADDGALDITRVQRHKSMSWDGYRAVLACGPALILDGKIDVQFAEEGFRDPHVTGRTQRMAIGITAKRKIVIAHIRKAVTFAGAAEVMQALGCAEAMNLDAGDVRRWCVQDPAVAEADERLHGLARPQVDRAAGACENVPGDAVS